MHERSPRPSGRGLLAFYDFREPILRLLSGSSVGRLVDLWARNAAQYRFPSMHRAYVRYTL